jgi:hypothetical protein
MSKEPNCPSCEGSLALDGSEKPGEEVFCPTCGVPSVLRAREDDEALQAEEDY